VREPTQIELYMKTYTRKEDREKDVQRFIDSIAKVFVASVFGYL